MSKTEIHVDPKKTAVTPDVGAVESFADESEQVRVRAEKLEAIKGRGENPFKNGFKPKNLSQELHSRFGDKSREDLDALKYEVSVAGRIMAFRDFGKACFVRVQDRKGIIQIYVKKDRLGDEMYVRFKEMDVGDIAYAEGQLFKTKTGELSVDTGRLELVTKSLRPLPEKFHGMTDVEQRYRTRYVDLIVNESTRNTFQMRSRLVSEIRSFFIEQDFLEVETPMMHPIAGGAAARPFITHHNTLDMDLYLRIAPELYLKRLLVGGFDRVFEMNRNFRNEGISIRHNPEFTMLEYYMAYATFEDLMDLTEALFQRLGDRVLGTRKFQYQDAEIDLDGVDSGDGKKRWSRISVEDAILKYSGFKERSKLRDRQALMTYLESKKIEAATYAEIGSLQMLIFDAEVEPKLIQPTFVTFYPLSVSPLARQNEKDPHVVDRFELFVYGREMSNAFSELNDPIDQKGRFLAQVDAKNKGDDEANDMDEDFVNALEYGMPPAAGQGIGIDRLVMLFTNSASIRDVILFPQMRKRT